MRKAKEAASRPRPSNSFTLVELLVVMAIIAILAALILGAGNGVMIKGMRSRSQSEIAAISTALESYKTDNGIYPQSDGVLKTNTYTGADGSLLGDEYQMNSFALYTNLSGQPSFITAPTAGIKAYMSFKVNQVGNTNGNTYIADPWRHAYGYSTGTTNGSPSPSYPYNGNGFFDLWSTAGSTASTPNTNTWISNWTQ